MKKNYAGLCSDLITPHIAMLLIPAFTSAYEMAYELVDNSEFLKAPPIRNIALPYLKNFAVEYELHRRSKSGILPFEATWVWNSQKNHSHLELRRDGFVLTVSQTHKVDLLPRECVFRNDYIWDGQTTLEGFENKQPKSGSEAYAILTHGWKTKVPKFLFCGIPNPSANAWLQGINLLERAQGLSIIDSSPVTEEIKLAYRNEAKEHLKDTSENL